MALLTGPGADRVDATAETEALFREAKRRERRRRALAVVAIVIVAIVVTTVVVVGGGRSPSPPTLTPKPATKAVENPPPVVDAAAFAHHGLLAFVSSGGLWVLDGSTGSLRQVAPTGVDALDPVFSPDGKWLAYLVDSDPDPDVPGSQLWMARSNGTDAHRVAGLARADDPAWSPTTDTLAVVENPVDATGSPAIWLIEPPGPATVLAGSAHADHFVWSPDGRQIALAGYHQYGSLRVVDLTGGTPVVWFSEPNNPAYPASYNPTIPAKWLAGGGILFWIDTDDSSSIEADGLELYDARSPGAPTVSLGTTLTSARSLTGSENGRFAIVDGGDRYAWESKTVDACASSTALCTAVPTPSSDVTIDPALPPSGASLAFVEAPSLSGGELTQPAVSSWYADHSLWITGPAGGPPTKIDGAHGASVPVWSANGRSLLYEADNGLWLLPGLTKKPVEIASPLFLGAWPNYYAQVDWTGQFTWSSSPD